MHRDGLCCARVWVGPECACALPCFVVDGVFEAVVGEPDGKATEPDVIFHPASGFDESAVAQVLGKQCNWVARKRVFATVGFRCKGVAGKTI